MKPTILLYLWPTLFIDNEYSWDEFDLKEWSDTFEWVNDPFYGLYDFVTEPSKTIESGTGDCDDYATVALNKLSHECKNVNLAFFVDTSLPPTGHVIAYTDDKTFSSGNITTETPEEYLERTNYNLMIKRSVNDNCDRSK